MKSQPSLSSESPRIVYLTAGAGGMFCGSCMHDNALAKAMHAEGWDLTLVPFYTPIRTDEADVSVDRVFFGGINVYLQQKIPLFRFLPSFLDRFLDNPKLIRRVTSKAIETDAKMLGSLALSVLKGAEGNQRKEVKRINRWLVDDFQPDLVVISNILVAGFVPTFKKLRDIPVLVTLQGDDVFLDATPEPYRAKCFEQIKKISEHVDGYIVHSEFFADYMSEYFDLDRSKIHVTPLGVNTDDFAEFVPVQPKTAEQKTIAYLARLAPEKGLHNLVDAFIELKKKPDTEQVRLQVAGWLGKDNEEYAAKQWKRLDEAGLQGSYEYLGSIDRERKLDFLRGVTVLSVPTDFQEPKGLFVLEALAAGVPVVQPSHGSFPEILNQTQGGLLFEPGDASDLASKLLDLLSDADRRHGLASSGQKSVHSNRCHTRMAQQTGEVFQQYLKR
jgi:glycosyltransferase involved in cell wall biosynthesis